MKRVKTRFSRRALKCGICLDLICFQGILNTCKHEFCHECILKWSKVKFMQTENRCPICKARFSAIRRKSHRREYKFNNTQHLKLIPDRDQANYRFIAQIDNGVYITFYE